MKGDGVLISKINLEVIVLTNQRYHSKIEKYLKNQYKGIIKAEIICVPDEGSGETAEALKHIAD